jgi:hypothetical protein
MKVYLDPPPKMSKGIHRVADALKKRLPAGVELERCRENADVVVFHVVGVQNFDEIDLRMQIDMCRAAGQRYAMMQYCLKTTENGGDSNFWWPLWHDAACVWSYYDLNLHLYQRQPDAADGVQISSFYYAPLGVEQDVFNINERAKKLFTIGTSGYVPETEGVLEAYEAVSRVNGFQFHLGPDFGLGALCAPQTGLTDQQVADRWNECDYVAGLRRVEGFELPAIEGILCGARPIVFDTPVYRQWYGGLAEFVPEGTPEELTEALVKLFSGPYLAPSAEQLEEAQRRFDWDTLCAGFWERVL